MRVPSRATAKQVDPAQAFLVGLLSGVDLLLGVDRDAFLGQLNLSESVCNALRKFEGVLISKICTATNPSRDTLELWRCDYRVKVAGHTRWVRGCTF